MTPEGITLEFLTNLGILPGDVLAPLIFIIDLDFILRLAIGPRDGFKVGNDFIASVRTAAYAKASLTLQLGLVYLSKSTRQNTCPTTYRGL